MLEIEARALCTLDKRSTTELQPRPYMQPSQSQAGILWQRRSEPGMVIHVYEPSLLEMEAGGLGDQGHPWLYKFEAGLGYLSPCLKSPKPGPVRWLSS